MKKIFTIIVIFIGWCCLKINWIGLQYDEVLFANAARGVVNNSFLHFRIWKFPFMLMPYIGAIKGYLYFAILKIFPISVLTIRLPMILLAAVSLGITYLWLKKMFNQQIAWTSCLLIAISPVFQQMTMFDVGPNSFEYFFKILSLCLWFYYLAKKNSNCLLGLMVCLILGVYNKLNFIWFVNSFLIGVFIFYFDFQKINKKLLLFLLIPISVFGTYFLKMGYLKEISLFSPERWLKVFKMLSDLVGESIFLKYLGVNITDSLGRYYGFFVLVTVLMGIFLSWKKKYYFKEVIFLTIVFVLMFVQIVLTAKAGAPWHIFILVPIVQVILSVSICLMRNKGWIVLFVLISYVLFCQYKYYFGNERNVSNDIWTKDIYSLIEYTKNTNNSYVVLDWGISNQLALFDPIKKKYWDFWPNFQVDDKDLSDFMYREYFLNTNYLYISHSRFSPDFPYGKDKFLFLIEKYKLKAVLIETRGNFEIYRVFQ